MKSPGTPTVLSLSFLALVTACGGSGGGEAALPSQFWTLVEDRLEFPGLHTQGLAALPALGPTDFVFTSRYTIDRTLEGKVVALKFAFSPDLIALGFDHLGDPDAHGTLVYGALEDNADPRVNSFHRGFAVYDAETLSLVGWSNDPGSPDVPEDGDGPWAAVSPDGTWTITGEWSPMSKLFAYRTATLASNGEIAPEAEIVLDAPPLRIQGCDFDGPRVLVCASDDEETGRFVFALFLSDAVQGRELAGGLTAQVVPLFPTPAPPAICNEPVEVEGIDVDGDSLRVLVIGTCLADSHLYRYERCEGSCS